MKLDVKALGIAFGILYAACLFLLGIAAHCFQYGTDVVMLLGSLYKGYDATVLGAIVGLFWGAADGFVNGILFGFLYNWVLTCCEKKARRK